MLKVENLHAGYAGAHVLHGVSLHVKSGSVVALIGANGAGKTTTMRAICGAIQPSAGTVLLNGQAVQGLPASRIARMGLAHCPEGRKVFATLSVQDNLILGAYQRLPHFWGYREQAQPELQKIYALFPRLRERQHQIAGTLSGGEQQMLALGRALMAKPQVILLDEPSMGLAPVIAQEVLAIVRRLKDQGITLLLVEQFAQSALAIADEVYLMQRGEIVESGSAQQMRQNPRVVAAYLE